MALPIIPIAAGVGLIAILALSKGGSSRPAQVFGDNQNVYRIYTVAQLEEVMVLEGERRAALLGGSGTSLMPSEPPKITLAAPGDFTSVAAEAAHLEAERLANEDQMMYVVEFANNLLDRYAAQIGLDLGTELQGFRGVSGKARLAAGYTMVGPSLSAIVGDQALATVTSDPLISSQQVFNLVSAGA